MQIAKNNMYYLQNTIREILETEAPLSEEYLLKRLVYLFDREKVTKVVVEEYNRRMFRCETRGIIRRNGFLYLNDMEQPKLRIPGKRREIKYIAIEELSDGLLTMIKQNVTVTKEGLYKTMTNLLGFSRTGDAIVTRFDEALKFLNDQGKIKEEDGLISVR